MPPVHPWPAHAPPHTHHAACFTPPPPTHTQGTNWASFIVEGSLANVVYNSRRQPAVLGAGCADTIYIMGHAGVLVYK